MGMILLGAPHIPRAPRCSRSFKPESRVAQGQSSIYAFALRSLSARMMDESVLNRMTGRENRFAQ